MQLLLREFPSDLPFTKRSLTGHREQRIDMLSSTGTSTRLNCVESPFLESNVVSPPQSNAVISQNLTGNTVKYDFSLPVGSDVHLSSQNIFECR